MNTAPAPELLVSMSVAPEPSLFIAWLRLLFVFTHFSIVLVCLKLTGERNISSAQNQKNITNL